jgi:hypothetical protein
MESGTIKKALDFSKAFCRGGQIRTDDLLLPKQTRYRATLHPEVSLFPFGSAKVQIIFFNSNFTPKTF